MSDTSSTSAIDEKQAEIKSSNNGNFYSNATSFMKSVMIIIIVIVLYFSSSGLLLYACKLAQSNIMPTDIYCAPYEDVKPNIQPIDANIFTTSTDPPLSMKIKFPYDKYNSSNTILDMFQNYKNDPNSNFLANYLMAVIGSLINVNFIIYNKILNIFNETFPESVIVILGPILALILLFIIFFINQIYLIYLWISNMSWFFKKNTNDTGTGKPKWDNISMFTSMFGYFMAVCLVVTFIFILWIGFPFLSFLVFFAMAWCFFSCILYKAEMNGKSITFVPIIQDVFKYYKTTIIGFFSLFVVISAFTKMGTIPGIISMITLLLIYFGVISIDLFNPINKEHLSPLTSYDQARKTCDFKPPREKSGFFSGFMGGGKKEGNFIKELKNISKTYLNKKT
jgi:hypothetical protein